MPPAKRRKKHAQAKRSGKPTHQDVARPIIPLTDRPPEIILEVFSYLDPVTSTCFGVTCKKFYKIHQRHYPSPIDLTLCLEPHEGGLVLLRTLLHNFIGKDMIFAEEKRKFVTEDSLIAQHHAEWRQRSSVDQRTRDWIYVQTKELKGKWAIDLTGELPGKTGHGKTNPFLQRRDAMSESPIDHLGRPMDISLFHEDVTIEMGVERGKF